MQVTADGKEVPMSMQSIPGQGTLVFDYGITLANAMAVDPGRCRVGADGVEDEKENSSSNPQSAIPNPQSPSRNLQSAISPRHSLCSLLFSDVANGCCQAGAALTRRRLWPKNRDRGT